MKKKIIIIIAIIAVLGVGGFLIFKNIKSSSPDINNGEVIGTGVPAMTLTKTDISNSINVSGVVESQNVVKITTNLTQPVKKLNVSLGDKVKVGDVLCVFDDEEIKKEIESLEKSIANADAVSANQKKANEKALQRAKEDKQIQLEAAQKAIDEANESLQKAMDKYNKAVTKYNDLVNKVNNLRSTLDNMPAPSYSDDDMAMPDNSYSNTQQEYETAKAELQSAEAEMEALEESIDPAEKAVESAKEAYKSAERSADQQIESCQDAIDNANLSQDDNSQQTQLDKLKASLDDTVIKATKDGYITSINVVEGSIATDGTLMTIEDTGSLKITVDIKEYDILKLKEGMKATITTEATGDEKIQGTVSKVINTVSSGGGNSAGGAGGLNGGSSSAGYKAEITIDNSSDLLIGMNAKAKIILDGKSDVFAVPYDAITTDENGNDVIYIAKDNGNGKYTVEEMPITKGTETDYYTEISGSGLEDGLIVITQPSMTSVGSETEISLDGGDMDVQVDENGNVIGGADDGVVIE